MIDMHDLVAPYALDALESEEQREFEAHLETCAKCREELALLQAATSSLAEADRIEPPSDLKQKVMSLAPGEMSRPEPSLAGDRRRSGLAWTFAAAAAAIALVFVGLWALTNSRLSDAERVTAVLEAADAGFIELSSPQGTANFVYSPSLGEGVFAGGSLAPPPDEQVYQLWLVDDSGTIPSSTFRPERSGTVLVEGVSAGQTIAMTIEPEGGSDEPTGDILVAGDL